MQNYELIVLIRSFSGGLFFKLRLEPHFHYFRSIFFRSALLLQVLYENEQYCERSETIVQMSTIPKNNVTTYMLKTYKYWH